MRNDSEVYELAPDPSAVRAIATLMAADVRARALLAADAPQRPVRTRKRKPSVASVIKQATRAGVPVARVEVDPDTGRISVISGKPEETKPGSNPNEWNGVILS